jgi:3-carboxy-cis,cis-muconate cycloisomerase
MTKSSPPSHVIDSRVFRDLYGSAEMRAVFADEAMVTRWLDVEAALARAQGRLGLIPQDAAEAITRCAEGANLDLDGLRRGVESTGHPLVPAIRALQRLAGEAGKYVHWGATTQDIIDTGFVLQLKDALGSSSASSSCLSPRSPARRGSTRTRRWPGAPTASMPCR